jgi:hypothetical protein
VSSTSVDTTSTQRRQRVAMHGGVARRRRELTQVSNRATDSEEEKNRGWGGWLPRGKALGPMDGGRGTTRAQVGYDGAVAARRRNGEPRQREPKGERVN